MSTPGDAPRMRPRSRTAMAYPRREDGAIAIMTVGALIVIIGFCGLALDFSQIHNRRIELQNAVDATALAAARELNGTRAGVDNAVQQAAARFNGAPGTVVTFQYGQRMTWSDNALEFGVSPGGPWQSIGAAQDNPEQFRYARVSTSGLDEAYGLVKASFLPFFSKDLAKIGTNARAVAGRSAIKVAPLAICAMRPEEKRNRLGELEEFGFRRGVAYDLMDLNTQPTASGQSFLINPLAAPGSTGTAAIAISSVEPYACTGTLGIPRVTGGQISVTSPFPLDLLFNHLNSRFKQDAGTCNVDTAPPDANVRAYAYDTKVPWMSTPRAGQSAALSQVGSKRWTVAGPEPTPGDTTAEMYGPLWSYAKAVQYASTEPAAGYTVYTTTNWTTLYNPGQPKATGYPSTTPYLQTNGSTNFEAPTGSHKGVRHRRVLNVALVECPVSGNRATVRGIGKFFMTVPADKTHLYAEFAGLAAEQTLNIHMKLYP